MHCSIPSCHGNPAGDRISRHRLPQHPIQRQRWQLALSPIFPETFTDDGESRICSRHFREQDFYVAGGKKRLRCTAVPSLKLGIPEGQQVPLPLCSVFLSNGIPPSEQTKNKSNNSTPPQSSLGMSVGHQRGPPNPLSTITPQINGTKSKISASIIPTDQGMVSEGVDHNKTSSLMKPVVEATKTKKLLRYAGDIKDVDQLSLEESKRALRILQQQLKATQMNAKKWKARSLRLLRKNERLKAAMREVILEMKAGSTSTNSVEDTPQGLQDVQDKLS